VEGTLRFDGAAMRPVGEGAFRLGQSKVTFVRGTDGKLLSMQLDNPNGLTRLVADTAWTPTPDDLSSFSGRWYSEEADATVSIVVENGQAFLTQRPNNRFTLRPVFKDHFLVERAGVILWLTRDASGRVVKLHAGASRLRDMPFVRIQ